MRHNYWLAWKLKRGLASRGRSGRLAPKGIVARALYRVYCKKFDVVPRGPRTFKQNVGGTLGPAGELNGD